MNMKSLVQDRLEQIQQQVSSLPHVHELRLSDHAYLQHPMHSNDCDLHFVLLVDSGFQSRFIDCLSWLTEIQHIAFKYRHVDNGYRFLFSDGIYCEFTVEELKFGESADSVNLTTRQTEIATLRPSGQLNAIGLDEGQDEDWLLGEMLTNLLIGLRRFNRGDRLSAFYCIQHHALSSLLELLVQWEVSQTKQKRLAKGDICFEQSYPHARNQVASFAMGYDKSPQSASAMLEYAEQHHNLNYFIKDQILIQIKSANN
ncbi:MAG: hypothetical protein GJ680_02265 [Alteromonadaceae bacterium]|nr:hypothetical protein [Alteromonadaceae bacterium]